MVYVLNRDGKPLMPCSARTARILLKEGKARVVRTTPFTIKLLYGSSGYKQEVVAGLDTGSVTIGCAAVANGGVVYQSEVTLRNDITKKMKQRAMFRRTRRGRKTRYRECRYSNRSASRRKGRLAPSITSKVNSHLKEVNFVNSILPVSKWKFELASFDIHKISNPDVIDYQAGGQKGFYNVKAYVLHRDNYACQSKQKVKHSDKLHVHHIKFRSEGGGDAPSNLVTLCDNCHNKLHNGDFKLTGTKSKTKHATEVSIIKSQLVKSGIAFEETFGYETKYKRENVLKLAKTHYNDAVAICCEDGELVTSSKEVLIKKSISKGDYQLRKGSRGEVVIPVGKLYGFRKYDKVRCSKGVGFIKGKRSSGYFSICNINNTIIAANERVTKLERISNRYTLLVELVKHYN